MSMKFIKGRDFYRKVSDESHDISIEQTRTGLTTIIEQMGIEPEFHRLNR